MSQKLNLTIAERIAANKLLDEFKGGLTQMSALLKDTPNFTVTEEEFTKAGLEKTPTNDGKGLFMKWEDKGSEKEVEAGSETVKYLKDKIEAKSNAGELTFQDKAFIDLAEKLK